MIQTPPSGPGAVPLLFQAEGLTKQYEVTTVLDRVGFEVPHNKIVSFVGENGAGKSTLFNILSGVVQADAGTMLLHGRPYHPTGYGPAAASGVTRVFQEQSLVGNVPVYENLLLGHDHRFARAGQFIDRKAMIAAAEALVEAAGIDVDVRRRTADYDFSKRQSIEIARACLAPLHLGGIAHPLVLLDEPTSALDRRDEEAFFTLIAKLKLVGSLLFVSHRLTEVLAVSDIIYVLKDGELVERLTPAEADENLLHSLMVGRTRAADYYHERRQRDVADAPIALKVAGLSNHGAYEDIDLEIHAGEVIGIGGLLDSGKSALGKGIAGVDPVTAGTVALGGRSAVRPDIGRFVRQGLGYVPAERLTEGMIAPFSLAWNLSLASGADLFTNAFGLWRRKREVETAARYIKELAIRSGRPEVICTRLSGGNQQKVVLARWLCRDPKVLVLDNPTRGVDAGAKEEIYRLIRNLTDLGVAILLITDELLELVGLSNRILIMQYGRIVAEIAAPADDKPGEREIVAWMLPQGTSDALESYTAAVGLAGHAH
ncbi:MAG: sugar ABC transporter ATP-binding protein [Azospirillaceae bacterium]|nr:sugar ABC transporter ATP-binding protein [Azospirillaceae bacterium]